MRAQRRLAVALLGAALTFAGSAGGEGGHVGYPTSIVALGDSAATGYNSDPQRPRTDARANSWVTGTNPSVQSIYTRLLALNPGIAGRAFNLAEDGSRAADLLDQAELAARLRPSADLVLVQLIGNDISCDGRDATRQRSFGVAVVRALQALSTGAPNARIFVVGDTSTVRGYAEAIGGVPEGRAVSTGTGPCDLFDSSGAIDQAHVDHLQGIVDGYEQQLATACSRFVHCRFDGGAASRISVELADYSPDYGHFTVHGLAKVAAAIWPALHDFGDRTPPSSRATVTRTASGKRVRLSASDDAGVSGLEYKLAPPTKRSLAALPFRRYSAPVLVRKRWMLVWRAVDVNGNSEATHSLRG